MKVRKYSQIKNEINKVRGYSKLSRLSELLSTIRKIKIYRDQLTTEKRKNKALEKLLKEKQQIILNLEKKSS